MSQEIDSVFEDEIRSFKLHEPSSHLDSRLSETLSSDYLELEDTISAFTLKEAPTDLDNRLEESLSIEDLDIEGLIAEQKLKEPSASLDFKVIDGLRDLELNSLESIIAEQELAEAPNSLDNRVEAGLKDLQAQLAEPPASLDQRIYESFRKLEDEKTVTPFEKARKFLNLAVSVVAAMFIISFTIKHGFNSTENTAPTSQVATNAETPNTPVSNKAMKVILTSSKDSVAKQEEGGVFYLSELPVKSIIETSIEHKRWHDHENNIEIEVSYPKTNVKFVSLPVD